MNLAAVEAARLIDRLHRLARAGEASIGLNPAQWEALRYLGRANRFSRSPAALADYLGSTRGTISRTLAALEAKGFVSRRPSGRDGRSVEFTVTPKATAALGRDPLLRFAADIEAACGESATELAQSLRATLRAAIARNGGRAFGVCASCVHFRAEAHPGAPEPHHCALLNVPLSEDDSRAICFEQRPRAA